MTHRPYRVGMARPVQRYIEPTEIYSDLKRGRSTTMPPNFGYTWTPVNGLDGIDSMGAIQDDLLKFGQGVIEAGVAAGGQKAKEGVVDFISSTPGKQLLDAVENKAREGVVKEVKKNAPNLMLFAIAGGAIGGALSAKLGKTGTVLAIGLAVWSGMQLMNPSAPPKK